MKLVGKPNGTVERLKGGTGEPSFKKDKQIVRGKNRTFHEVCEWAKQMYYNKKISQDEENSKKLFKTAINLHTEKTAHLPTFNNAKDLADSLQFILQIRFRKPEMS